MNRHERRKAGLMKSKIDSASKVFTMKIEDKKIINVDVRKMRAWSEINLELSGVPVNINYAESLLEDGTVSREYVMRHTIKQIPRPIIACHHKFSNVHQIVDGNNTYVAVALSWNLARRAEQISTSEPPEVEAYVLTEPQWRQFIIPDSKMPK